jgi:hypothetical protein
MSKMMHASRLQLLVSAKDTNGAPIPFSITYRKKNGQLVKASNVVVTSWFSNGRTMNILYIDSREVRKIKRILVFKINEIKIYL